MLFNIMFKYILAFVLLMSGSFAFGQHLHPPHHSHSHHSPAHNNFNYYSHYYAPRVYVNTYPLYYPYPYTYVSPYVYYPNGMVYVWVNGVLIRVR